MRFDYYDRLPAKQKATYRKSDAVARIPIPDAESLKPMLEAVRIALEADDRGALGRATTQLAAEMLVRLEVAPLTVRVLARRPSNEEAELHGLYVREDDGSAVIRLWMRTAAHVRPVRFRTFIRTLAHELLHHLDFELLKLEDTFHNEGFFRRESDLVRQLLGERKPSSPREKPSPRPSREQLSLFQPPRRR